MCSTIRATLAPVGAFRIRIEHAQVGKGMLLVVDSEHGIGGRQMKRSISPHHRAGRCVKCVFAVYAGLAPARAHGVNRKAEPLRLGRPPVNTATERYIRKLRAKGMGILEIASTPHTAAIDPKTGKPLAAKA